MSKIYKQKLDPITRYALIQPCTLQANLAVSQISQLTALLDTGATHTYIGQGIVDELKLTSSEYITTSGISGISHSKLYCGLRVKLPNYEEGFLVNAICTGAYYGLNSPFNFIVGMDIIKRGDFHINSKTKEFILDFSNTKL